ncbi:GIY-YIG nuclease family protein [Bacillus sp. FJAT-29937]|uniref:GIY-YIG nuclease family protein n=1 Tax=Bacillus sp. FJAT-29937 TaxID=1720553 RepID=UPI0022B0A0C9|nr:GIY-YIG nuclease family protein [Bacillus sp. FJAT-29937]
MIPPPQQYKFVKETIQENVPKGNGGLYIILREGKVLYIGESEKNIHNRLRRHIDKIYKRTDKRSDFFKLAEHQGKLSIYFWVLSPSLIGFRKAIEDLLTNALEPEYKKWDLKNKMILLDNLFKEEKLLQDNKHQIELHDGDFYDELDKDDMLDRLGQHSPAMRKYWEEFEELTIHYGTDGILTVNIGADDPMNLESNKAFEFAANIAKRKGYSTFYKAEDDIRLYGQNCLTERMFYFKQ